MRGLPCYTTPAAWPPRRSPTRRHTAAGPDVEAGPLGTGLAPLAACRDRVSCHGPLLFEQRLLHCRYVFHGPLCAPTRNKPSKEVRLRGRLRAELANRVQEVRLPGG